MRRLTDPLWLTAPAVLFLIAMSVGPLFYSIWLVLHDWTIMTRLAPPFVGLANFSTLFGDSRFWMALLRTLLFVAVTVGAQLLLGLIIALLLNRDDIIGTRLLRTLAIIPIMVTPVVVGYIFRLLFHPSAGPVNHLLETIGFGAAPWTSSSQWALPTVMLVDIWQWTPFMALILLAGLQSVPQEQIEAATLDGANRFQSFIHIVLPSLAGVIAIGLVLRSIDAFKLFDTLFIITGGGPGTASEMLSYYTYLTGFSFMRLSYAASMAWVQLIVIMILAQIFIRRVLFRRDAA